MFLGFLFCGSLLEWVIGKWKTKCWIFRSCFFVLLLFFLFEIEKKRSESVGAGVSGSGLRFLCIFSAIELSVALL